MIDKYSIEDQTEYNNRYCDAKNTQYGRNVQGVTSNLIWDHAKTKIYFLVY